MVLKTKGPQIRCIRLGVIRAVFKCKSSCKRTRWLTKLSPKAKITYKEQKLLSQMRYILLTGCEDRLNVNQTAKHTLVLINVLRIQPYSMVSFRLKFNLQRKR